jgi:hypothetical protein
MPKMQLLMLLLAVGGLFGCGAMEAQVESQALRCEDPVPPPPDAGSYVCPPPGACEAGVPCDLCPQCCPWLPPRTATPTYCP